ncbi:MAG TPA: AAA family ATPase, partial [Patescibacteria group bacterium]|nr:AAA family ATPase [Patescibacteria group bacterium]
MQEKPTLYMMLGYPGAGKTTVSEILARLTGAIHLNSDNLRLRAFNPPQFNKSEHTSLYATLDYLSEIILKSGKSVIYDANLNKYEYRKEKYDICTKAG